MQNPLVTLRIFVTILAVFFPVSAMSWTTSTSVQHAQYSDYIFAKDAVTTITVEQSNGFNQLLIHWTCPNEQNWLDKKVEIHINLDKNEIEDLPFDHSLMIDLQLRIDNSFRKNLTYDFVNERVFSFPPTERTLNSLSNGKTAYISYTAQKDLLDQKRTMFNFTRFSLTGSSKAIHEASSACQQAIESHTSDYQNKLTMFYIISGLGLLVALVIGLIILKKIIYKTKKVGKKAKNATRDLIVTTQKQIMINKLQKQEQQLKLKFAEAALDEIAREAVRQAMRENRSEKDIDIEICKKWALFSNFVDVLHYR